MASATATLAPSPAASPAAALTLANVLYEKKSDIAYVTVNRPKVLNALNTPTWKDLRTAFEAARDDVAVRGVILTGAGDKAFVAGADISELAHVAAFEAEQASRFGQEVLDLIENLGKPVVAAVNGFALGGGCETAMACTIRIAVDTAKFGQPEVALGLLPGGGGTQRLPRLVGKDRALEQSGGTKLTFRDGMFRTGDVGYRDADGYFFILDRAKDMIVTGGENVYSGEVEAVIYEHPAVLEAAVFGIPDPQWGELVAACVVRKPGSTLSPDELIAHCRRFLANYKVPRHIEFSETELPKSGSGKILKRLLRERFWVGPSRAVG
jgi:enoyl-CoA hydratase/carnithine racemase